MHLMLVFRGWGKLCPQNSETQGSFAAVLLLVISTCCWNIGFQQKHFQAGAAKVQIIRAQGAQHDYSLAMLTSTTEFGIAVAKN